MRTAELGDCIRRCLQLTRDDGNVAKDGGVEINNTRRLENGILLRSLVTQNEMAV